MRFALLSLAILASACSTVNSERSLRSSARDENPDHFWLVREVQANQERGVVAGQGQKVYGLFACYRAPTPNQPQCLLAKSSGLLSEVASRGALMMNNDGSVQEL